MSPVPERYNITEHHSLPVTAAAATTSGYVGAAARSRQRPPADAKKKETYSGDHKWERKPRPTKKSQYTVTSQTRSSKQSFRIAKENTYKMMPQELLAPIAEAKETRVSEKKEPLGAPLRLMTQFLRAVSENRMEQALALAQTILKFEPRNAIILDYQATLAQYINNERELASVREGNVDNDGDDNGDDDDNDDDDDDGSGDETGSAGDESASTATGSDDGSTEEASAQEASGEEQEASRQGSVGDEQELQRLGGVLRDLRKTREARSREIESRWAEDKFAASQREVEAVLWKFLPDAARQAAEKRAADGAPDQRHCETAK